MPDASAPKNQPDTLAPVHFRSSAISFPQPHTDGRWRRVRAHVGRRRRERATRVGGRGVANLPHELLGRGRVGDAGATS